MKAFDGIRRLFAAADLSRLRGYTPSTFSFNVEGGRCETCRGEGLKKSRCSFSPMCILPVPSATAAVSAKKSWKSPTAAKISARFSI